MKNILLITLCCFFSNLSAQKTNHKQSIDSLLHYFQQNNAFSGSVLIQKADSTVYKGNYNKFNPSNELYRIGSITKMFTAVVIYQLIEEDRLTLDTKLSTYYPEIKYANEITIQQLLNHTSGLYNYLEWDQYYANKEKFFTSQEMLDIIKEGTPEFKPGKGCKYSNSNYLLLGYIIEKITLKSFSENVNDRIVSKLGLKNTYCETNTANYHKRNKSHTFNGASWVQEPETHPSFSAAAGEMVSTSEDLSKFINNLFKSDLISPEHVNLMAKTSNGMIGHGLFYMPFNKMIACGHSGGLDEFTSVTIFFLKENVSMTFLSIGRHVPLNDVVVGVASKYFNTPYTTPNLKTYASKTATTVESYEGSYKAKLLGVLNVGTFHISRASENYLYFSMHNDGESGEKALLQRIGENKFYNRKISATLDFLVNDKGKVTGITLTQGKQSIKCKKIS